MPIYEFECGQCGRKFETLTSISKREEAKCPHCGGTARRTWTGHCSFGSKAAGGCSGSCANCPGCHHK